MQLQYATNLPYVYILHQHTWDDERISVLILILLILSCVVVHCLIWLRELLQQLGKIEQI